jgi:uncharacterized protein (TIGR03437 family)
MDQARFGVSHMANTMLGRAAWRAPNPAAGYDAYVTEAGVSIAINDQSYVSLSLRSLGYGETLQSVGPGEVSADKQTINLRRYGGLREWYVNGPEGLEQGFTLSEPLDSRPAGAGQKGAPLRLVMQVSEGWRAVASDDGKLVTLRGVGDQAVEYGKLVARDSLGRVLAARLTAVEEQVVIEVEDSEAAYPLTIDPLFTLQQRLLAPDGAANDRMGLSVALSGNTALVGAPYDDAPGVDQGSAYVFARNGSVWTLQAKLTANDGAANDLFGQSVALDGDTALVGALYGPGEANSDQGAVYVFTRNSATQPVWTQRQRLNASDGASGELFGGAVALGGDTALVGARVHRVGTKPGQGAAYVFARSGEIWTQQKQLTANDGEELDQFGAAVALDGDTALVGAPNDNVSGRLDQGSAYVFTRDGANWTQRQKLTDFNGNDNDQFGAAVALSGEKALVGAYLYGGEDRGAVIPFKRGATGWEQTSGIEASNYTAGAHLGVSVALSGDTAVIGASLGLFAPGADKRTAYVFHWTNGDWKEIRRLGPELGEANDRFGYAVALDGDTALVGAYQSDGAAADQGAAYVFALRDDQHVEQQKLTANDGAANDLFGATVALNGDTLVVGAPKDDIDGKTDQGAVYVFTRNGATQPVWTQRQKLIASDGAGGDFFGCAIALSGDTLVVGAYGDDINANLSQGSVYIFTRNDAAKPVWTLQQKLIVSDGAAGDGFGGAVALDGDTLLAGAKFDDVGANHDQGSAYVFARNGAVWAQQAQLFANAASADDWFGSAVALSGDTAVVGAARDDNGARTDQGSVFVFTRSGATQPVWTRRQQLTANDGVGRDYFGNALALSGDTLVIGASDDAINSNPGRGVAYVFTRGGGSWTERQKLTNGGGGEFFGAALALGGDRLVIGAPGTDNGRNIRLGAAYVFTSKGGGPWTQQQKLTASDGAINQLFGNSVAIDNETVAVSAPYDTVATNLSQGSAYVFVSPVCQDVTLAPSGLPNAALGAPYSQPLTAAGSGAANYQFTVSGGALPPGMTLDPSGMLQGTPTATGAYRFTLSATNLSSLCAGSRSYTFTVTPPCPTLTLNPATLPKGKRGALYNQALAVTGGVAPYSYAVTAGALPPGLSLSASGVLSGAPMVANTFTFTLTATAANGCTAQRAYALTIDTTVVTGVSAASYFAGAAPESIVAAFGAQLAGQTLVANELPLPTELAGVSARVRDSLGVERLAPLFFVAPGQINLQVPAGTAIGSATVSVSSGAAGSLEITRTAPGLFTANASGQGVPAALALRVRANGAQSFEPVAQFDGARFVPVPIDLGPPGEQVFLALFGTGIRFQQKVSVSLNLMETNVLFAGGVADFAGLDQVNLMLPRTLAGQNLVDVVLRVDGVAANSVRISVR